MPSILLDYSYWWLAVIVIIATGYSYILYRKDKNLTEVKKYILFLLRFLRFSTIVVLLFLLLNPLFKSIKKETENPIIAILQDNSQSVIMNKDSNFYKTKYLESIKKLQTDLSDEFETIIYSFGEEITKTDSINFSKNKTNISNAINKINDLYINRNLGAIILATDGIYNSGVNPKYININSNTPLYTVLLGDTSEKKDVLIKNVIYNNDVFLGNNFPLKVILNSSKLEGEKVKVKILSSEKLIAEKELTLSKLNKIDFELKAEKKGLIRYKILVETKKIKEENTSNNNKEIVINVIDSRKKILLLSNSPHPDISAIKNSFTNSNFYEVDFKVYNGDIDNLKDYNLVIFHQLPSKTKQIDKIVEQLINLNISTLFIVGAQTDIESFNKINTNFSIEIKKKTLEETAPELNEGFSLFTLNNDFKSYVNELPPVISYFANYKSKAKYELLFAQKIRNILTSRPLFMFAEQNTCRTALISGEGLWRWRVYDFQQNKNFENFNTLVNKTVQYLTANIKDNPLTVSYNKVYQSKDEIIFNAQFLNKSFELVNTPDLIIQIKNEKDVIYNYSFDKFENKYRLKINGIEKGDYTFNASLNFANENYIFNGNFSVLDKNYENLNTVANHNILRDITQNLNGESFYPNQLNNLKNAIEQNPNITKVNYYQSSLSELINNIWIFIFIVLAISLEWFIRKYLGGY